MTEIPTFRTERLFLREITDKDFASFERHFVDYEVIRHLSIEVPWPYPDGGVRMHFTENVFPRQGCDLWIWGISLRTNPSEVIGAVELYREGVPEHRGFWLGKAYWGLGLMTEAVQPVLNYAFHELGFDRLIFANAKGNTRSRRIKEKTGAHLLRTVQAEYVDPDLKEKELWELTKKQWVSFEKKK